MNYTILADVLKLREAADAERDTLLKEFAGECGMCVHYEDCTQNHYSGCDGADWEWIGLKEE